MTDLEQEAAWRTEFEADGERAVLDTICHGPGIYPDPKRSFALRWLREREVERARQEQKMRSYVRCTFWAAVAAVATGIVAMLVTWFARWIRPSIFRVSRRQPRKSPHPRTRCGEMGELHGCPSCHEACLG